MTNLEQTAIAALALLAGILFSTWMDRRRKKKQEDQEKQGKKRLPR